MGGKPPVAVYARSVTYPATKSRLGGRLLVAQLVGMACGLFLVLLLPSDPAPFTARWWDGYLLLIIGGLLFSIPAYAITVLVLLAFAGSILRHPFVWCIAVPVGLLALSLLIPSRPDPIHWLTALAVCVALAGATFYAWQRLRPMTLSVD